jgi:hypothetical protein
MPPTSASPSSRVAEPRLTQRGTGWRVLGVQASRSGTRVRRHVRRHRCAPVAV